MWRIAKYFFITTVGFAAALFMVQSVYASESTVFLTYYDKCSCTYNLQEQSGQCLSSEESVEVGLGEEEEIEDANGEDIGIKFSNKENCENLLQPIVEQKKLCSPKCQLYHAVTFTSSYGDTMYDWKKWYNLKWESNVGTKSDPIKVTEGEVKKVEVKAGGTKEEIEIKCIDCDELGINLNNKQGSGEAEIVWDTSAHDLFTKVYVINLEAYVAGAEATGQKLTTPIYFSVTGISPVQTTSTIDAWIKSQYGKPKDYAGALPDCAFSGTCRSINDLLQLIINFASGMFVILGSFAFAFFVYGGFKMIVSMGNAEMVETGKKTMIAAALGLVVATLAYTAIDLMLDILNVSDDFRGIK